MDHQSFRFYIPGVVFLTPIYFVICYITTHNYADTELRSFVLIGGIAAFPAIALPIGWWIYNIYRVWWILWTKGYENKDFVRLICKDTTPFFCPLTRSIHINFSHIAGIESWIKMDAELFRKTFYPFTSKAKFKEEIRRKGVYPKFAEPLSDFILWKDSGYDYARSISSVRYGLESSIFALILGGIYTLGLKQIWLFKLHKSHNQDAYIFWVFLLVLITTVLIATLIKRWKDAGNEYDARLILTTVTSMKSNHITITDYTRKIPSEIYGAIEALEIKENSYAAFDLDNTLLIGDIGEAVFACLLRNGHLKNYSWEDYQDLIKKDRESAYKKIIQVMNGMPLKTLKEVTYEIIRSEDQYIELNKYKIPLPKPNLIMQALVSYLMTKNIDVFVVTASNQVSAEIICWKYFGIPFSNTFGADFSKKNQKIISEVIREIPYENGKVDALKKRHDRKPIITAGDGIWDKSLLDFTVLNGIRLWLGRDKEEYNNIKEKEYNSVNFFYVSSE